MKKFIFFCILTFLIYGCSKQKTIDELINSANESEVNYAINEIWRLNKTEYTINLVNLLTNEKYKIKAAFALSFLNSETIDKIIYNNLNKNLKNADGFLFYFFLVSKKRKIDNGILQFIRNNFSELKDRNSFIAYMLFSRTIDKKYIRDLIDFLSKNQINFDTAIEKELLLLIGEEKFKITENEIKKIFSQKKYLKPFIIWAENRLNPKKMIKVDKVDRIITENNYWKKYEKNPVIPTVSGTFKSVHTANPDLIVHNSTIYLYYRGGDGNDRIAVATVPYEYFDGIKFIDYIGNPVIDIGKKSFDDLAVLDPATIYFNNKLFLYYSGLGTVKPDSIGLAVSNDFFHFAKAKKNPVLKGRAPEVLQKDGVIYLYYVLFNTRQGYSIYLATSRDGYNFTEFTKSPVFEYSPDENEWDSKTVTTPRIIEKDGVYYMVYAGDNRYLDYPPYFGIAFSYDLINWYRSTQNPIFSRGKKGEWDDGGIWFAQIFEYKNKWYMWYEGWGGGEAHKNEYGRGGHSQIGLAICDSYGIEDML